MPLALADSIKLKQAALAFAPLGLSENNQAFRPTAKSLMAFSANTLLTPG